MRSLAISGVALAALMVSQPALAEIDSGVGAPPMAAMPTPPAPPVAQMPRDMPPMATGPNRRLDYQRPSYGFQLPQQWMSAEHAVNYREHGLDRPAPGFGWSRYYNDMVLTDQWGRVYDVAGDYDRGGQSHGGGGRYHGRDTDGIVGGVAGAAVGAVAGNVIAGAGSRLAGSLIGGGVGALVGLGVELAINGKRRGAHYDDRAHDGGQWDRGRGGSWGGSHWGGYPHQQAWGYQNCNCGGGETVTTTTVVTHGGGGYMVPRQVVAYENIYAPVRTKYVTRAAAPTKYRVREEAPVAEGKTRVRLHTKTY